MLVSCSDVWDLDGYRALEELGATHLVTFPWVFYGAADDDLQAKVDGIHRFADDVLTKLR